jgi:hypothetical protein
MILNLVCRCPHSQKKRKKKERKKERKKRKKKETLKPRAPGWLRD